MAFQSSSGTRFPNKIFLRTAPAQKEELWTMLLSTQDRVTVQAIADAAGNSESSIRLTIEGEHCTQLMLTPVEAGKLMLATEIAIKSAARFACGGRMDTQATGILADLRDTSAIWDG